MNHCCMDYIHNAQTPLKFGPQQHIFLYHCNISEVNIIIVVISMYEIEEDIGVIIFGKKFKMLQNELITVIKAIFMLVISNIKHFNRNIYCNELTKDHSNILYSNAL